MEDTKLKAKAELNLKLLMWIKIFNSTLFWLGIWVLYYLKFTDYAGIGLIETAAFIIGVALEIPAGITSDKFGHKTNLVLFGILTPISLILFASANSLAALMISTIIWRGSYAFFSGSFEALIHESLQYLEKEDRYQSYISKIEGLALLTTAFSALAGGIIWSYNFRLTLWLTVPFLLIATALSFKLTNFQKENTQGESLIRSLKDGSRYIFKPNLRIVLLSLLGVMVLRDLFDQIFDALLKVSSGMSSQQMGLVSFVSVLLPALASLAYSRMKKIHKNVDRNIKLLSIITLVLSLPSIFISKLVTAGSITFRAIPGLLLDNTNIEKINKEVPSKHRSTAISSYTFVKSLPYALLALPIGSAVDQFGANKVTFSFSLVSIAIYFTLTLIFKLKKDV